MTPSSPDPSPESRRGRRTADLWTRRIVVLGYGAFFGTSAVWSGFYDSSTWGWIALVAIGLVVALAVASSERPSGSALAATASLAGLWLWALGSKSWAESSAQAVTEANRLALYAALLGIVVFCLRRDDRVSALTLGACAAGLVAVEVGIACKILFGEGGELFLGSRLNEPAGYVNAQASFALLGVWPLLAVAERLRRPVSSALSVSGAVFLAAMCFLSQSRGAILASAVAALALLLLVPGRRERVFVLLLVAVALVAIRDPLMEVFRDVDPATASARPETIRTGVLAAIVAAAGAGVVALALNPIARRILAFRPHPPNGVKVAIGLSLVVATCGVVVGGVLASGSIARQVERQYDEFVNLKTQPSTSGGTRLASGGGYRFDYWRVAVRTFRDEPLKGVGAGNYDVPYFSQRRTTEDVRQPHSLELQTLSELGVVGAALLTVFLISVLAGFWVRVARARSNATDRALTVAAGGIFVSWLVHTSVDWLHLIPGLTAMAIAAAGVLVSSPARKAPCSKTTTRASVVGITVVLAFFAASSIVGPTLASRDLSRARTLVSANPAASLDASADAIALDAANVQSWRVRAAAYARLDRYSEARGALLRAVQLEPRDWVTWALLGDLALRRRDVPTARAAYRRALLLNPRDTSLGRAAKDPLAYPPARE